MITLSILFVLFVVGLLISRHHDIDLSSFGWILSILCGILLFTAVIAIPLKRMQGNSDIATYKAFKETVEVSRLHKVSEFERAAITIEIANWNQYVARAKYYNQFFDLWIPDELVNLEPIK